MKENIAKQKSKSFAIRSVNLYRFLTANREYVMSKQVLRSGTSIGANLAEAECAISKRDFASKLYIAYKECAETKYWLELLYACGYLDEKMFLSISSDCEELFRLLAASTKTVKKELQKED